MEPESQRQHKYSKTISYDLEISMEGQSLNIYMKVVQDKIANRYWRLQLQ